MSLTVFCCCTYRTAGETFTQADWGALKFIKAIKSKPVNGYAQVPVFGQSKREFLNATTASQAPDWFGRMVANGLRWSSVGAVTLVPIPNSACDSSAAQLPKAFILATAAAAHIGDKASVADVLRWKVAKVPAHQGGTRDVEKLFQNLALARNAELPSQPIILVDDVMTSGAHLRAAAAFLRARGANVAYALCAGRADNAFLGTNAFAFRMEELEDYTPPVDDGTRSVFDDF
jgi:hypothetical protein